MCQIFLQILTTYSIRSRTTSILPLPPSYECLCHYYSIIINFDAVNYPNRLLSSIFSALTISSASVYYNTVTDNCIYIFNDFSCSLYNSTKQSILHTQYNSFLIPEIFLYLTTCFLLLQQLLIHFRITIYLSINWNEIYYFQVKCQCHRNSISLTNLIFKKVHILE